MSFLRRNLWACALLLTGAAFVGLGAWRGEAETVLRKASEPAAYSRETRISFGGPRPSPLPEALGQYEAAAGHGACRR